MREIQNSNILKAQQCVELMQGIPMQSEPLQAAIADNSLLGFNKLLQNLVTSTGNVYNNKEHQEKLYASLLNAITVEQQKNQQLNFLQDRLYDYSAFSNCSSKVNFSQNNLSYPFLSPSSSSTSSGKQSPTLSIHSITKNDVNKLPLLTQNNVSSFLSNSAFFSKHKVKF